jgi:hypothetical protein
MDVSASFSSVDALQRDWYHCARLAWVRALEWAVGGYWFPDYVADLDVLLRQLCQSASPRWP